MPNLKVQAHAGHVAKPYSLLVERHRSTSSAARPRTTLERQQQVAFSNTIFVIGTRLMTKKDSGVKDFGDLKGKTVVTTAGTTSERLLRKMNQDKNMGMNIISAKDHGDSFLTLSTGRAVAFMMDDALLAGERAKVEQPGRFRDRRHAAIA